MTVQRRSYNRRKSAISKRYARRVSFEEIITHERRRKLKENDKMAEDLINLLLRFSAVHNTEWLTAKLDEAKALISNGSKDLAIEILDAVKTNAEELGLINSETQRLIEKQQTRLKGTQTCERKRKNPLCISRGDVESIQVQFPMLAQTDSSLCANGDDKDNRKYVLPIKRKSEEKQDGIKYQSKQSQKATKSDPAKWNRSKAHYSCEAPINEVTYQRDKSLSSYMTTYEAQRTSFDKKGYVKQQPTDFSRTENNLPIATDEGSQLVQRLRDIVQKIKTQFRNFERDKSELLRNAEREREISEREIHLAWRRYVMDILGLFQHIHMHGNDQLQEILMDIRRFGNVERY